LGVFSKELVFYNHINIAKYYQFVVFFALVLPIYVR
jgi:hypothetical protein